MAQEPLQSLLARANALASQKDLTGAQRVAREALQNFPDSRDARLTLANVLLWEAHYAEARAQFSELLKRNERDADARIGRANAEYWSGDYRGALRDFRAVPDRADAKRAIAEIESAAAPGYEIEAGALSDDQPYHSTYGGLSLFAFSDPLTKWQLDIQDGQLASRGVSVSTPLLGGSVETTISRVTLRAALAGMRVGGSGLTLPSIAGAFKLSNNTLTVGASREALLRTSASLQAHPTADILFVRWARSDTCALHAEHLRYFDANQGNAIDAYLLHPFGTITFGVSAAFRDSDQSRFAGGEYEPYYTPQNQRDLRGIVSWTAHGAGVHLDAGIGHDAVAGEFHPWRASLSYTKSFFSIAAEHNSTAFYKSNEIRASVAGRF